MPAVGEVKARRTCITPTITAKPTTTPMSNVHRSKRFASVKGNSDRKSIQIELNAMLKVNKTIGIATMEPPTNATQLSRLAGVET